MSLEGIVSEYRQPPYRQVLDEYRRQIRDMFSDVYSHVKRVLDEQPYIISVNVGGLEGIAGGVVYKNGATAGDPAAVRRAQGLKEDYQRFISSEVGRALGGDANFDGYIYDDLAKYSREGKRALAAVIETDGRKYLAINSRYADRLSDMAKLYVLAHEQVHGKGEKSEVGVENRLKKVFSDLAGKARDWYNKNIYERLAAEAAMREQYAAQGAY